MTNAGDRQCSTEKRTGLQQDKTWVYSDRHKVLKAMLMFKKDHVWCSDASNVVICLSVINWIVLLLQNLKGEKLWHECEAFFGTGTLNHTR